MNERTLDNLKTAYTEYLSTLSIGSLRSVGREKGVSKSTLKKKNELIGLIVSVLTGELPPAAKTNRGAPVKDGYIDPQIFDKLEEIKNTYLSDTLVTEQDDFGLLPNIEHPNLLEVSSQEGEKEASDAKREVYSGQLETINGVSWLLPFNCRETTAGKIIVSVATIQTYDLREGDIVACYTEKRHATYVATEVLSVNGLPPTDTPRIRFEESSICYPCERISLSSFRNGNSVVAKYADWLIPFGKGQRTLIASGPKAGKTALLKEFAEAIAVTHPELRVLVLLADQTPECVKEFSEIVPKDDLVYTTYDDEPDKHVFAANFLLKRAKRYAEAGMDVVLLVDSLTTLAHAYNETEGSEGTRIFTNGLKSKTLYYIRKFLGAARCLERGGSLTIFGTVALETGNSSDSILAGELSRIANAEIFLSESLALKRVYPAIDAEHSSTKQSELLFSEEEAASEKLIRNKYLPSLGNEKLVALVRESATVGQLCAAAAELEQKNF